MSVNMAPSPAPIKPVYSFPLFAYLASATAVKAAMAVAAKTMLAPPISENHASGWKVTLQNS